MINLIRSTSLSLCILILIALMGVSTGCGDLERDEWDPRTAQPLDHTYTPKREAETSSDSDLEATLIEIHSPDSISCEDAPLVTWSTFGQGFMTTYCQGCHAREAPHRYGAPEGVSFDTRDETLSYRQHLLRLIVGDEATMPPGGGVNPLDLSRLVIWLTCAEEATP